MLCAVLGFCEGEVPPLPEVSAQLSSQDPQAAMGLGACGNQK